MSLGCETPVESNWIKRLIRAARAGLTSIVIDSTPVDVLDSSGNGRNGMLLGTPKPIFVPAYFDKGLSFDGVSRPDPNSQGIDFTGTGLGNNPQGIDIEFKIKFDTTTRCNLWMKGTGTGDAGLEFSLISDGSGYLSWTFRVNLPTDYYLISKAFYVDNASTPTPFTTGVWYTIRLVAGIEGTTGYVSAFVNGTRTGFKSQPSITGRTVFNNPFYFGRNVSGADRGPFHGLVDEIRIFDSPQLASSVTDYTLAGAEYAPSGDGLYHLNGAGASETINPSSLPKATPSVLGITRISVPAADPANPVAVGDNDIRAGRSVVDFVATTTVQAYKPVTGDGQQGDSTMAGHRGKIIGLAWENVASGFPGKAITSGQITNPAWSWVSGDRIFLNGTSLDRTPPTTGDFLQQIGVAINNTTIEINIKHAVRL